MKNLILLCMLLHLEAREFQLYPQDVKRIKKICKVARGGDVIYLNSGVYRDRFPQIKCSGSEGAPITITAKKGAKVTIRSSWRVKGNYLTIANLNFRGYSDSLNYSSVIKQWWRPTRSLRQKGLLINGHHIIVKDNAIGYYVASGVKFKGGCDYITVDHNIIYNNAWWTTGGTGGLIMKTIEQIDHSKATKVKIVNNLFFGNESRIFSHLFKKGFSKLVIDEGESFLLQQKEDSNKKGAKSGHYEGRYLVKNNLILYNGKGSSLNKVQRVDFVHNYLYCNGTTANNIAAGGIRGNHTSYDNFLDNFISSCGNRLAVSVVGEHNFFKGNIAKSKTQKPMVGLKLVDKVFNDPENLDFNSDANRVLASFQKILHRYNIEVKPTGYIVDKAKQVEDIIRFIPKKADTVIKRYKDRVEIKNIDNRGIKWLGDNFILKIIPTF